MSRSTIRSRDALARSRLKLLLPRVGPWTSIALWHGRVQMASPPDAPLEAEIGLICDQRLAGLLSRYLRESGTRVAPELQLRLQRDAFVRTSRAFAVASAGAAAIADVAGSSTPCLVSKGPGIARLYPGLDCRPYGDIDILVPRDRFGSIVDALEQRGWREEDRNLQPWAYFRAHCREGLNLVRDGQGSLDVHHRAPPWIWSRRFDVRAMVARAESVVVGDVSLRCVSAVDNLMIVALHLVSDRNAPGQTLIVWRDLLELIHAAPEDEIVSVASELGMAGWLRAVMHNLPASDTVSDLSERLPDAPVPSALRLSMLLSPRAADLGVIATQFLRLPLLNGLAFTVGMALPSPSFLRRKYPDERHVYRRWWFHSPESMASQILRHSATANVRGHPGGSARIHR